MGQVLIHGRFLYYFQTNGVDDEHVSLARFCQASGYSSADLMVPIPELRRGDARNGKIIVSNSDVYFIKLRNTGTQTIELFRWSYKSAYQTRDIATGTRFPANVAEHGQ